MRLNTLPAFYKKNESPEQWMVSTSRVVNSDYTLLIEDCEEYSYPLDGWVYHESPPAEYIAWYEAETERIERELQESSIID